MTTDYVPIECGLHDHLEVHALRGDELHVAYVDASGRPRSLSGVRLSTLRSRGGEEIAVFRHADGTETLVRLDRLRSVAASGGSGAILFPEPGSSAAPGESGEGTPRRTRGP